MSEKRSVRFTSLSSFTCLIVFYHLRVSLCRQKSRPVQFYKLTPLCIIQYLLTDRFLRFVGRAKRIISVRDEHRLPPDTAIIQRSKSSSTLTKPADPPFVYRPYHAYLSPATILRWKQSCGALWIASCKHKWTIKWCYYKRSMRSICCCISVDAHTSQYKL